MVLFLYDTKQMTRQCMTILNFNLLTYLQGEDIVWTLRYKFRQQYFAALTTTGAVKQSSYKSLLLLAWQQEVAQICPHFQNIKLDCCSVCEATGGTHGCHSWQLST